MILPAESADVAGSADRKRMPTKARSTVGLAAVVALRHVRPWPYRDGASGGGRTEAAIAAASPSTATSWATVMALTMATEDDDP